MPYPRAAALLSSRRLDSSRRGPPPLPAPLPRARRGVPTARCSPVSRASRCLYCAANFCPPSWPVSPGRFLCNQCAARLSFCCARIIKPCAHAQPAAVSPWARLRAKFWVPAFARKCLPATLVPRAHLSWASSDPSICFVWAQRPWLPRWLRALGGYFLDFPPFSGLHCTMSNSLKASPSRKGGCWQAEQHGPTCWRHAQPPPAAPALLAQSLRGNRRPSVRPPAPVRHVLRRFMHVCPRLTHREPLPPSTDPQTLRHKALLAACWRTAPGAPRAAAFP